MPRKRLLKHLDFVLLDFLTLEIAYFIAYWIKRDSLIQQSIVERYFLIAILIAVAYFLIEFFWNIYSGILRRNKYDELKNTLALTSGLFVVITSIFFFRKTSMNYSRVVLFSFYIISSVLIYFERVIWKRVIRNRGINSDGEYLAFITKDTDITKSTINGMSFTGVITMSKTNIKEYQGIPVVACKDEFKEYVRNHDVQCVYFYTNEDIMNEYLEFLVLKDVVVYKSLRELSKASFRYSVQDLNENHTLRIRNQELPIGQLILKRLVDIFGALIGIILSSPIMLVTAILIKLDDGGPVFYVSKRVGLNGKEIGVLKFRSMKLNADKLEDILTPEELARYYREFKLDNDPRITKIGNFIRKFSIDELPQFFNVLKGDMSFIGPRPVLEQETQLYGDKRDLLLSLKPGITGYWQAFGRNNITYESGKRQAMELYYIEHFSLWFDIKIFFRTFIAVISSDGAQ